MQQTAAVRSALEQAKARLDTLPLYPAPVRIDRVRVLVWPRLFRLPWFRRFDGYSAWLTILLRSRAVLADEALVAHELCHVWQMQHHPLRMFRAWLTVPYETNPFEVEARRAVEETRMPP